jgi:hypothetical protein
MSEEITGGCQCGATRFRGDGLGRASICHCRMCQKAFGAYFGPLVTVTGISWTRGEPKHFASSNLVRRGFCPECGTPLTYEYPGGVDVAIGALDNPDIADPVVQLNPRDKRQVFERLHLLPGRPEAENAVNERFLATVASFQHPDHDTDQWPPERK